MKRRAALSSFPSGTALGSAASVPAHVMCCVSICLNGTWKFYTTKILQRVESAVISALCADLAGAKLFAFYHYTWHFTSAENT